MAQTRASIYRTHMLSYYIHSMIANLLQLTFEGSQLFEIVNEEEENNCLP